MLLSGQRLRQTPGATTSNAGATGMRTFHSRCNPSSGLTIKAPQMNTPAPQASHCATRQILGPRVGKALVSDAMLSSSKLPFDVVGCQAAHGTQQQEFSIVRSYFAAEQTGVRRHKNLKHDTRSHAMIS